MHMLRVYPHTGMYAAMGASRTKTATELPESATAERPDS